MPGQIRPSTWTQVRQSVAFVYPPHDDNKLAVNFRDPNRFACDIHRNKIFGLRGRSSLTKHLHLLGFEPFFSFYEFDPRWRTQIGDEMTPYSAFTCLTMSSFVTPTFWAAAE
jgi:hypothetical protein